VIADTPVFDGKQMRLHTSVVVEDGRVSAVGRHVAKRWRHLAVIKLTRATLIPGFTEAHTHTTDVSQLQEALQFGVTTILDMWTPANETVLRDAAAKRTDVADFRSADILATVLGGHGTEFGIPIPTVSGPDAAEAFVEARRSAGADYLKIVLNGVRNARSGMPNMDESTARALVEAGHKRGMLVAHIENLQDVRTALSAGVDGFAHTWRQGGAAPDLAGLIVRNHVFVVPTPAAPDGFVPGTGAELAADPRLKPFLSPALTRRLTGETPPPIPAPVRQNIEPELAAVRSLVEAGATLLAGTDPPNGTVVHGVSLHRELELLVKAGLTPVQALAAATSNAADAFRLRDRGRIVSGAWADLELVQGDPSTDITATRAMLKIWRSGVDLIGKSTAINMRVADCSG